MQFDTFRGPVRHLITFIGGLMVSHGWIKATQTDELVGALMVLASVVWSIAENAIAARNKKMLNHPEVKAVTDEIKSQTPEK